MLMVFPRLKVRSGRLGSNSSLSLTGRPEKQESWELLKPTLLTSTGASVEVFPVDLEISAPTMFSEVQTEGLPSKAKAEDLDLQATITDNLIDFSDPSPVLPPVPVQPKPLISPRWIVPAAGHPVTNYTNGLLDPDPSTKTGTSLQPDEGALTQPLHTNLSSQTHNVIGTSIVAQRPKENGTKTKGLLTTEL
ncbi:hypothetical protein DPEC_G00044910 [Dallia pectoralis]|uniref:Uncharacterized protein n=1 Tax=Dallia pectoralis TaxID=75939 RepID=A0ACC2H9Z3_DALPE|nr:hypothetical protein DPEC_G00044910 [Dallia pectoralis]